MRTLAMPVLIGTILLLSAPLAGGQEKGAKDKPDPDKFGIRLEIALLIENPQMRGKALLVLAGDAAEDGKGDIVKKCLASLPDDGKANEAAISLVLLKMVGHGLEKEALEAAKALKDVEVRDKVLAQMADGLAIGPDALWKAAEKGDDNRVTKLLNAGVPVNAKDKDGETALMKAAARGHIAVVKVLIANKAELSEADSKGETALMKAVANGHDGVFDVFWNQLASHLNKTVMENLLNASDRKGMTIFMKAAAGGNLRLVTLLRGVRFKEGAFEGGEITWLVRIDAKDNEGKTALQHAEANGHKKVVELLKEPRGEPKKD